MSQGLPVESHAGHRREQEPRVSWLGERRVEVLDIVDRWVAPEARWFQVKAGRGDPCILRHRSAADEWDLAPFRRGD